METVLPTTRIYLDYAAATPLTEAAFLAMQAFLRQDFGNPSAIHAEGRVAREAIEQARTSVARVVGVKTGEVVFTGSGTESNNLALLGHIDFLHQQGRAYETMEVITTAIEHPSILSLLPRLIAKGVKVQYAAVTEEGIIERHSFAALLSPATVMVSCAYVNSEIGTIQPIAQLTRAVRAYEQLAGTRIYFHVDGAQAPLWLSCQLGSLGADSITLDAGKCGGPKGVGLLISRKRDQLAALHYGGSQEGGVRPGTENVAGIVGAAVALVEAQHQWGKRASDTSLVRDQALEYLAQVLPGAKVNGALGASRVANNLNFSLPGFDTEYAVIFLDARGVAASTKSACAGAGSGRSQVVYTIANNDARAASTIRLSLGPSTTLSEVRYTLDSLADFCQKMKPLTQ